MKYFRRRIDHKGLVRFDDGFSPGSIFIIANQHVVGKNISENKILEIDSVDPGLRNFYDIEIVICFQSDVIWFAAL